MIRVSTPPCSSDAKPPPRTIICCLQGGEQLGRQLSENIRLLFLRHWLNSLGALSQHRANFSTSSRASERFEQPLACRLPRQQCALDNMIMAIAEVSQVKNSCYGIHNNKFTSGKHGRCVRAVFP